MTSAIIKYNTPLSVFSIVGLSFFVAGSMYMKLITEYMRNIKAKNADKYFIVEVSI